MFSISKNHVDLKSVSDKFVSYFSTVDDSCGQLGFTAVAMDSNEDPESWWYYKYGLTLTCSWLAWLTVHLCNY